MRLLPTAIAKQHAATKPYTKQIADIASRIAESMLADTESVEDVEAAMIRQGFSVETWRPLLTEFRDEAVRRRRIRNAHVGTICEHCGK